MNQIHQLRLAQGTEVKVVGKDYRGLRAEIRFSATERDGWFWRPFPRGPLLPIEIGLARYYPPFGFIYLRHGWYSLAVYEHVGAPVFTGLTGIIVEGTAHPPYHGRALELWEALNREALEHGGDARWCRPVEAVEWRYPNEGRGRERYTRFEPHTDIDNHSLDVEILSDYPGIGALTKHFSFPADSAVLNRSFRVHAQGFPKWKRPVARIASYLGWPHFNCVTWPSDYSGEEAIERFVLHRLTDVLGAFSLVSHNRLPAGRITSIRSGHLGDLEVLRRARFAPC
ncbi:MAG: hypothetical protein A2849_01770 [Candidatus Taylorbacteria bacterium RIFCSPHIGHO2_01_FULL_51_15]|uniref:Uncharacterized protein n=1 Tax=Candidatus Taylorbacteria bacterium RIFCSPHIGHO2_01_FULL_51_15 TaxID=1802304 RepID=A0A1G2MAU7_9BACT|nr:MAG: hypothetical protein A2849_01770 [Candidatus Taylorbacteria bacterium RIFCSPHIGHO2_01_FULL_51_15]